MRADGRRGGELVYGRSGLYSIKDKLSEDISGLISSLKKDCFEYDLICFNKRLTLLKTEQQFSALLRGNL